MTPGGATPPLPIPQSWDGRFIFPIGLLLAIVASGALIVFGISHFPPTCDEALVAQSVPWGWHKWRELPSTSGFHLVPGKRREPPHDDLAFVVEDGVCPGEGAAIDATRLGGADAPWPAVRIRESPFREAFVVTAQSASACPAPTGEGCEAAVAAFRPTARPEGLPSIVLPLRETLVLVGIHLAAAAAIAWGIERAQRSRRFARELLDPGRFVEATCREDGTLFLGTDAVVVRRVARPPIGPGPVLVRLARSSSGDYRTPPVVRVEEVARGGRAQASDRAMRRASMILNGLVAVAVSAAILGSWLALGTWVTIGSVDKSITHRHDQQRHTQHVLPY
jgi:hypothetical protein